jgi:hypothetical protein
MIDSLIKFPTGMAKSHPANYIYIYIYIA